MFAARIEQRTGVSGRISRGKSAVIGGINLPLAGTASGVSSANKKRSSDSFDGLKRKRRRARNFGPIAARRPAGPPDSAQPTPTVAGERYSNPSFRIRELAVNVLPPRNHGDGSQLTALKGTDAVTVMGSPATALAGSGDTSTVTPGTATFAV